MSSTASDPWQGYHPSDRDGWADPAVTPLILGGASGPISEDWGQRCGQRVRHLRDELRGGWVGLAHVDSDPKADPKADPNAGLTDWLLAGLVARENVLLVGPPGTAKTEIALRTFQLLGLCEPEVKDDLLARPLGPNDLPWEWWKVREAAERRSHKYFHYLLSKFTQPEELFGPVEIGLLRQGFHVRVNFGLLTGAGVRAAFLDEVFKASSSILNTLLTLTQERRYPNWGRQMPSDLVAFVAASNETPGGYAGGADGQGGGDEFTTLHAFLDRFPLRLAVPMASGTSTPTGPSALERAFVTALAREGNRFATGHTFTTKQSEMPSINDLLLFGRYTFQHCAGKEKVPMATTDRQERFRKAFLTLATDLQGENTNVRDRRVTWTISPRKLKALYKIALAHAAIRGGFGLGTGPATLSAADLRVFDHVWDAPAERGELARKVQSRARDMA